MKRVLGMVAMVGLVASITAADTSNIRGKVIFSGVPPTAKPLRISGDDYCERVNGASPLSRENVIVNPDSTLNNVVVWVESGWPDDKAPQTTNPGKATFALERCSIRPHVIAIQTNQTLEIINKDDTVHNINSRPAANGAFNYTMPASSEPVNLAFAKPEIGIKLRSDIHPWMIAWVSVFDHPAFDVTGADGQFELPALPVGEYRLAAWHEEFGMVETDVLLQRDIDAEVEFTFTGTGAKSAAQTNSFSTARPTSGTVENSETTVPQSK